MKTPERMQQHMHQGGTRSVVCKAGAMGGASRLVGTTPPPLHQGQKGCDVLRMQQQLQGRCYTTRSIRWQQLHGPGRGTSGGSRVPAPRAAKLREIMRSTYRIPCK